MSLSLAEITQRMYLAEPGRRILVVEDHLPWLYRLSRFWMEAGHEVVGAVGIDSVEEGVLRGAGPEGMVECRIDEIDAAFLDHYFLSQRFNGVSLTRAIQHWRPMVRICGMSSDTAANLAMIREGAVTALRKAEFMRLL